MESELEDEAEDNLIAASFFKVADKFLAETGLEFLGTLPGGLVKAKLVDLAVPDEWSDPDEGVRVNLRSFMTEAVSFSTNLLTLDFSMKKS